MNEKEMKWLNYTFVFQKPFFCDRLGLFENREPNHSCLSQLRDRFHYLKFSRYSNIANLWIRSWKAGGHFLAHEFAQSLIWGPITLWEEGGRHFGGNVIKMRRVRWPAIKINACWPICTIIYSQCHSTRQWPAPADSAHIPCPGSNFSNVFSQA